MFDSNNFPKLSVLSPRPMVSFKCSARRKCSETEVDDTSVAMLDDQGKCSALLAMASLILLSLEHNVIDHSLSH